MAKTYKSKTYSIKNNNLKRKYNSRVRYKASVFCFVLFIIELFFIRALRDRITWDAESILCALALPLSITLLLMPEIIKVIKKIKGFIRKIKSKKRIKQKDTAVSGANGYTETPDLRDEEIRALRENLKSVEQRLYLAETDAPDPRDEEIRALRENLKSVEQRLFIAETEIKAGKQVQEQQNALKTFSQRIQEQENEALKRKIEQQQRQIDENERLNRIIAENNKSEYEQLLREFIAYIREYMTYYFQLDNLDISITSIYANPNNKSIIVELDLGQDVRVGQVRYRLGSMTDYLNVKPIRITKVVSDLSRLGLEIPLPDSLCYR